MSVLSTINQMPQSGSVVFSKVEDSRQELQVEFEKCNSELGSRA